MPITQASLITTDMFSRIAVRHVVADQVNRIGLDNDSLLLDKSRLQMNPDVPTPHREILILRVVAKNTISIS